MSMKAEKNRMIRWAGVFLLLFLTLMLILTASANVKGPVRSIDQLNDPDVTIGISTGSATENSVRKEIPKAKLSYYDDKFLGYTDVANGKIDAFVYDQRQMELSIQNGQQDVHLLKECLKEPLSIAVGISNRSTIPDLPSKINQFISEIRADGTLDDMYQRWVIDGNEAMPDIQLPKKPTYHLRLGTSGIVPPYSYYEGAKLTGYDIELAYRFAAWLNADLLFQVYDYGAIIPAAQSGKIDCIMADLQISEERQENFLFSEPLYEEKQGIMVRATGTQMENSSIWAPIRSSFEKTFVREKRWNLFVKGILNTIIITLLSIVLGTALGFGMFMLCREGNPVANAVTGRLLWLVQGMPMVVLLMVLYYIVFGRVKISGILVAVAGFTLTFGAAVFGLLKLGVVAVDDGQYEAAYALGYSRRRTFFRIVLPQALPHVMPAYRSEVVNLIKMTAIVGYITVQDLTKMGDIVRSRTYEAFFPLIAVTVIYFVLEGIIGLLIDRINRRINPKLRSGKRILKGVKTDE